MLRSHLRQAQALGAVRAAAARGQYDTDTPRERGGSLGVIAQWKHRRHGCGTTLAAHRGGWRRAAWTEGEGAARATSADSPACCGASGALDAAAVRAARLMPREVRARGGTGGADGAAGRDRAAAPQHMVGDLHTRTDVLWWCALHCKIPTLQWVGVYIGLDEQYQCTGFPARGLTEECACSFGGTCFVVVHEPPSVKACKWSVSVQGIGNGRCAAGCASEVRIWSSSIFQFFQPQPSILIIQSTENEKRQSAVFRGLSCKQ